MKRLVLVALVVLFPTSLFANGTKTEVEIEIEKKVEEVEDCGAPYHVVYEYRQFREYTRPYYILVDSCGNELSYTLTPPGLYVEL